jgi:hypothetical protein
MNPYDGKGIEEWGAVTRELVNAHPLTPCIVELCLKSWQSLLHGKINTYLNLSISEMGISPQSTAALLHDVIPVYIEKNIKGFRKGVGKEKDIVCEYDEAFSLEVKASSSRDKIYGNRSYPKASSGKSKSGYYLAVNFEKVDKSEPRILLIRMGWLDLSDWRAQESQTGQQASLNRGVLDNKLITLYKA